LAQVNQAEGLIRSGVRLGVTNDAYSAPSA